MTNRTRIAIALAALAGGIATANADVVLTMTYDDLAGSYTQSSPGVGSFSAVSNAESAGEVSRLDGNPGNASFEVGYVNGANSADFALSLSVNVIIPNQIALGSGTLFATDADGDTISADIEGAWLYDTINNFIFFNGSLTNVVVADNGQLDDLFNGSQFGDFQLSGMGLTEGAVTQIVFGAGSFFNGNFSNAETGLTAQIIPTPGTLALVGLGGLVVGRRRR